MRIKSIKSRFGEAVRRIRTKRGLSQEQLADLCGLDRSYIGGVERGERNPSVVVINRIAGGLEISMSDLFREIPSDEIEKQ